MYEGLLVGSVASILSLASNLAATVLTAYKAWCVSSSLPRRGAYTVAWLSPQGPSPVHAEPRSGRVEEHPSREHIHAPRRVGRALLHAVGACLCSYCSACLPSPDRSLSF